MSNGPYLKDDVDWDELHHRLTRALAIHILKGKVVLYHYEPIYKTIIDFIVQIVEEELRGIDTTDPYVQKKRVQRLVEQMRDTELIPIERLAEMLNAQELLHGEHDE